MFVSSSGFNGDGQSCVDIDECGTNTNQCHNHADCTNTDGNYTCACHDGFTGDGRTCTDNDECTDGSNNCHLQANCENQPGTFTCTCNLGWSGTGIECIGKRLGLNLPGFSQLNIHVNQERSVFH